MECGIWRRFRITSAGCEASTYAPTRSKAEMAGKVLQSRPYIGGLVGAKGSLQKEGKKTRKKEAT